MPTPLNRPISFETALGQYTAREFLGSGGAGTVYGGESDDGKRVAVKVLDSARATTRSRRRFQNEIAFLQGNRHANLVPVLDHGLQGEADARSPFYVMPRFDGCLPELIAKIKDPDVVLSIFAAILDGVEAAHLRSAWHRDLKPKNILVNFEPRAIAIADFGIAHFAQEDLVASVETLPHDRLANFTYAAPEQRVPGSTVDHRADVFALGMILNEMFTGVPPSGVGFRKIASVQPRMAFLDPLIDSMLAHDPSARPASINEVKLRIKTHHFEAAALQRIDELSREVVPEVGVQDPLATEVVAIQAAEWDGATLHMTLSHVVNDKWKNALRQSVRTSVMGYGAEAFRIVGKRASVECPDHVVQRIINHLKEWLPAARQYYKSMLEAEVQQRAEQLRRELTKRREAEELKLKVNKELTF